MLQGKVTNALAPPQEDGSMYEALEGLGLLAIPSGSWAPRARFAPCEQPG